MAIKNAATSGPRFEAELEVGKYPLQLYSLGTPNGQKVTVLLEELGLAYDAFYTNIMAGENFSSGFVAINPNEKIPALVDKDGPDGQEFSVFESAAIMLYLLDKVPDSPLMPNDPVNRSKVLQWPVADGECAVLWSIWSLLQGKSASPCMLIL